MNIAEAKKRVTIHDLWRHFGFSGKPSQSCRCPFHQDKSPSFSVTQDGLLFNCFAGCGGGDAVDFFQHASGLSKKDACREFPRLAGGTALRFPTQRTRTKPSGTTPDKEQQRSTWPTFENHDDWLIRSNPQDDDEPARLMAALAALRHVSLDGVKLTAARRLLWFGRWRGVPAWVVADTTCLNAQARRMDGQLWEGIGAKAQTLPGSLAAWPLGVEESVPYHDTLLCEGGPDLLAAHHFITARKTDNDDQFSPDASHTAAVGMLGASLSIPDDALPLFAGKRVRIMAHADEAGRKAAQGWADQLQNVGATVDIADFTGLLMADGSPVKDLNDCTQLRSEDQSQLDNLIPQ